MGGMTPRFPETLDLSRYEHLFGREGWDRHNWGLDLEESYIDPESEIAIGRYPDSQGGGWCIEAGLAREELTLAGPYGSPQAAYSALLEAADLSAHALDFPPPEDEAQTFIEAVIGLGGQLLDEDGSFAYAGYVYEPSERGVGYWLDGNRLNLVPTGKYRD